MHFTDSVVEQVCTKLARGGPNNATYVTGFTVMDREHTAVVGIDDAGTQMTSVNLSNLSVPTAHKHASFTRSCFAIASFHDTGTSLVPRYSNVLDFSACFIT